MAETLRKAEWADDMKRLIAGERTRSIFGAGARRQLIPLLPAFQQLSYLLVRHAAGDAFEAEL